MHNNIRKKERNMYYLEPNEKIVQTITGEGGHRIKNWGKKQWKNTDLYELLHI